MNGLIFVRGKINEHFKQNKHIEDAAKIKELIQFGSECEVELRTNVIQAVEKSENHYGKLMRKKSVSVCVCSLYGYINQQPILSSIYKTNVLFFPTIYSSKNHRRYT